MYDFAHHLGSIAQIWKSGHMVSKVLRCATHDVLQMFPQLAFGNCTTSGTRRLTSLGFALPLKRCGRLWPAVPDVEGPGRLGYGHMGGEGLYQPLFG